MNHNIKVLRTALMPLLFSLAILFANNTNAQSSAMEIPEKDTIKWEINTVLSPFANVLMGGGGSVTFSPLGFQLKKFKGSNALRIHLDYGTLRSSIWETSNVNRITRIENDIVHLMSVNFHAHQFRAGLGYERGKKGKLGRAYLGGDFSLTYRHTRLWSSEQEYNVADNTYEQGFNNMPTNRDRFLNSAGIGAKAFVGLERPLNDHLGFNLEVKYDMMAQVSEGYSLLDDGSFVGAGNYFNLETLPLLDLRFYYKF
jgi:hypothetical protein